MNQSSTFLPKLRWKLCLPEYLLRPKQIVRRIQRELSPRTPEDVVRLPWGLELRITEPELILNAVWFKGVYDIVASETIWRLLDPGETALDIGAHVGYMTSIMATRVGPTGKVVSFEPDPALFRELRTHADEWRDHNTGEIVLNNFAVGRTTGEAAFARPEGWDGNRGIARLVPGGTEINTTIRLTAVKRLDDMFGDEARIGLAKVDVESHELAVFQGAERLLRRGAIRDIVFEDLGSYPSPAMHFLEDAGYTLFGLAKQFQQPRLCHADRRDASPRDDPNYVATRDPERVRERMHVKGWDLLRDR